MCERKQALTGSAAANFVLLGLYVLALTWPPWLESVANGRYYYLWNTRRRPSGFNATDLPVYFKGVRALGVTTAILHLVGIVVTLVCLLKNKLLPVAVITDCLYVMFAVSTVAVMGSGYRDDPRVKDKGPELGFSFRLATVCPILAALIFAVSIALSWKRKSVSPSPVATITRRPSNASVVTIDGGRKITIFRSETLHSNNADFAVQGEKWGDRYSPPPLKSESCSSEAWLENPVTKSAPYY